MGHTTSGRFGLAALCVAVILLVRGDMALAAVAVLLVLLARLAMLILDVFWTSFTGNPLLRAQLDDPEAPSSDLDAPVSAFGRLSSLPAPLREKPARRVPVFAQDPGTEMPATPSRRLKALKERLGYH